ncbi:MAG: protein kinase, partial [Planctomycetota bacterium]|nr:protein kinase [Planctomycetota bacterium]
MNQNEEQGRWILSKGWLSQEIIAEAWQSSHSSGVDLCEALLRRGAISSEQAELARSAINPSPSQSNTTAIAPPQYEVIKELGRGGMGVVFLARHKISSASCVIKLMLGDHPSLDSIARFEREAQTLAQFKHRSIVGIKEYGSWNGLPFFVMDHIDGQDLKSYIDDHISRTGEVPDYEWTRALFIS